MKRDMNSSALRSLALSIVFAIPSAALAGSRPVLAPAPVQRAFIPEGFDDNDNVEVILHGHFPNSCMKVGPVDVSINADSRVVSLKPEVYAYESELCAQVSIPFMQKVALGHLPAGAWKLELPEKLAYEPAPLVVHRARSAAPDDALYAPVDEVVLIPESQGALHLVVVSGRWPEPPEGKCFELVRVANRMGADNALVVLPIVEIKNEGQCKVSRNAQKSFVGSAVVNGAISEDVLVHVRVMNGDSLNKFYEANE
ncbi:MAG: hypothetical protein RIR26_896 [Pseudomonadota bacterium]|jgi:hypothetical protein